MSATILIVDDDSAILEGVKHLLAQAGFEIRTAADGKTALSSLEPLPQLIVLDLMLPDIDGHTICRKLRELPIYIPILMLSARDDLTDKVLGLELGADDYVTKPFEPRELLSRIRALLRFAEQRQLSLARAATGPLAETVHSYGPIKLWSKKHRLEINGRQVELTPTEWELLELFITNPGQVFGRETLLRRIWGENFIGDSRTVDTHMQRLRAKLEIDPNASRLIQTVRGFGYRLLKTDD